MTGAETLLKNRLAAIYAESMVADPFCISALSLANQVNVSVTTARNFGRKYSGSFIEPFVMFTYNKGMFSVARSQ